MADKAIRDRVTVSTLDGEHEIAADRQVGTHVRYPGPFLISTGGPGTETWYIAGTEIVAPVGATLRSCQTHPTLGCLSAEFQLSPAVGDGRLADGETFIWRRPTD